MYIFYLFYNKPYGFSLIMCCFSLKLSVHSDWLCGCVCWSTSMRSGSFFPYLDHFWPVLFLEIYSRFLQTGLSHVIPETRSVKLHDDGHDSVFSPVSLLQEEQVCIGFMGWQIIPQLLHLRLQPDSVGPCAKQNTKPKCKIIKSLVHFVKQVPCEKIQ